MDKMDAFVNSSSAWITLIGFLISIFGVYLTYKQARDARLAAQDAKTAAEAAALKVIGFDASVSIFNAVEVLQRISDLIAISQWQEANWKCIDVRKILERAVNAEIEELRNSEQVTSLASYLDALINNLLEKINDDTLDIEVVNIQSSLVKYIVSLSGFCEILRQREVSN